MSATSAMYKCHKRSLCAYIMSSVAVRKRLPAASHTISWQRRSIFIRSSFVALGSSARASTRAISSQWSCLPRLAASRIAYGSSNARVSYNMLSSMTSIPDTNMPRRGITVTNWSRARRWSASRIGVRPMPSWACRVSSLMTSPGASSRRTILFRISR